MAEILGIGTTHQPSLVGTDEAVAGTWQRIINAPRIDKKWRDRKNWQRSAILNTARTGWFSSDRAIAEYADDIWKVPVRQS